MVSKTSDALAGLFNVSQPAMEKRLRYLGFIDNEPNRAIASYFRRGTNQLTWRRKEHLVGRVISLQPRTEPPTGRCGRCCTCASRPPSKLRPTTTMMATRCTPSGRLRRAAERLNADVVDEYVDRGKSARSANRPQLQLMLRRIRDQRDVDYVIVHKVDRLARSRADDVQIVLALRQAGATSCPPPRTLTRRRAAHCCTRSWRRSPSSTPATWPLKRRKAWLKKAEFGGTPGPSPVGYRNIRDRIDGKDIGDRGAR